MMNQNNSKTKKGNLSRQRILNAAITLINSQGYEKTTIVDICNAAGVSNGTFYHHFKSKQDILVSYVEQESEDLVKYYNSLDKTSYSDVMLKVIKYNISYFLIKGTEFVSNFYSIALLSKNNYYNLNNFSINLIFLECFKNGQKNGEFTTKLTAGFMSEVAASMLYKISTSWCIDKGNFDLHEEIRSKFLTLLTVFKV